jgi:hypothetical protein
MFLVAHGNLHDPWKKLHAQLPVLQRHERGAFTR